MDLLTLVIVVLVLAWAMGAFVVPIGGSAIHLLLVVIVIIILVRVLQGRNIV